MDDLDLDLDHSPPVEPPRRKRTDIWIPVVVALLVVAAAGWYFFVRRQVPDAVDVRTETTRASGADGERPIAEPGADIDVPPLDASDALVRELVTRLSSHPLIASWLTTDQLIRNFTVVVVNIAGGHTPAPRLGVLQPKGEFLVLRKGDTIVVDPRSYRRYDGHAAAFAALDAKGAAQLYATLEPRIGEAAQELGSPGDFKAILTRAMAELLATPVVDGDVQLVADSVSFSYADPRLQELSPVQRQFLRMGPQNVRLVQQKLREMAPYLGIAADALPSAGAGQS
jgi:hypothetical protein